MSVSPPPTYPAAIEQAIAAISEHLRGDYPLSQRTLALLLLQDDPEIWDEVQAQETPAALDAIRTINQPLVGIALVLVIGNIRRRPGRAAAR